ncbi:hypothetical protein PENTCL1PPCAC_12451, partial [Pristionchus entomophagus]
AGRSGTLHVLRRLHQIGLWGPPHDHHHRCDILHMRRIVPAVLLPQETPHLRDLRHGERSGSLGCLACS